MAVILLILELFLCFNKEIGGLYVGIMITLEKSPLVVKCAYKHVDKSLLQCLKQLKHP